MSPDDIDERAGLAAGTRVPRGEALRFWTRLGFISFGGPAGQIAILHRELVERRRWIPEERFLHALGCCMLLPGPEAQQLATWIGWLLHGTAGGVAAGVLFVLPSAALLLGLSWLVAAWGSVGPVAAALAGIQPVVVALVVEAAMRIGGRALHRPIHAAIAAAALVGIGLLRVPFPAIVAAAAVLGGLVHRIRPDLIAPAGAAATPRTAVGTAASATARGDGAVVGEGLPAHARPSRARTARLVSAFLALWLLPMAGILATLGGTSVQAEAYRFFTRAAFVTFGGAYAVLAYVVQFAVEQRHWLDEAQALAGLGLAETTPGPLIIVLQFVGFMAGWNTATPLAPLPNAVTTALAATWATFLPSTMLVLVAAPYLERLRNRADLAAALSSVTAAVAGVVAALGIGLGLHVLRPGGAGTPADPGAAAVAIAALVALARHRVGVVPLVLAGAAIGLLRGISGR